MYPLDSLACKCVKLTVTSTQGHVIKGIVWFISKVDYRDFLVIPSGLPCVGSHIEDFETYFYPQTIFKVLPSDN